MWTTQLVIATLIVVAFAALGHRLGRVRSDRARVRRVVRRPTFLAVPAILAGAGLVLAQRLLAVSDEVPRRYADYLPTDAVTPTDLTSLGWLLAAGVGSGSLVLLAVRLWLRHPSAQGRSLLRHGPVAAGLLLVALAVVADWRLSLAGPPQFGWYMYAPMSVEDSGWFPGTGWGVLHAVTTGVAVSGLAAVCAVVAFRVARRGSANGSATGS